MIDLTTPHLQQGESKVDIALRRHRLFAEGCIVLTSSEQLLGWQAMYVILCSRTRQEWGGRTEEEEVEQINKNENVKKDQTRYAGPWLS